MPGASEQTSQVKVLNVNWTAGADGEDGRFEVMIVTADGEKHTFAPSPASRTALLALAKTDVILLWDPAVRTLIAANMSEPGSPRPGSPGSRSPRPAAKRAVLQARPMLKAGGQPGEAAVRACHQERRSMTHCGTHARVMPSMRRMVPGSQRS